MSLSSVVGMLPPATETSERIIRRIREDAAQRTRGHVPAVNHRPTLFGAEASARRLYHARHQGASRTEQTREE